MRELLRFSFLKHNYVSCRLSHIERYAQDIFQGDIFIRIVILNTIGDLHDVDLPVRPCSVDGERNLLH